MRYVINIEECHEPNTVRFWGTVEGIDCCNIAEDTLDEFFANAPGIIRDVVETSNENGANLPLPTSFEFRLLVTA